MHTVAAQNAAHNSMSSYPFLIVILAFCLTPSCNLTVCALGHYVPLRREADLRDALIDLGRAAGRKKTESKGSYLLKLCICMQTRGTSQYTLFQL